MIFYIKSLQCCPGTNHRVKLSEPMYVYVHLYGSADNKCMNEWVFLHLCVCVKCERLWVISGSARAGLRIIPAIKYQQPAVMYICRHYCWLSCPYHHTFHKPCLLCSFLSISELCIFFYVSIH